MKFSTPFSQLFAGIIPVQFHSLITSPHGIIINYANQRPYVWSSKEINQLLDDLYDAYLDFTTDKITSYFLHNAILSNYDNHRTPGKIVD